MAVKNTYFIANISLYLLTNSYIVFESKRYFAQFPAFLTNSLVSLLLYTIGLIFLLLKKHKIYLLMYGILYILYSFNFINITATKRETSYSIGGFTFIDKFDGNVFILCLLFFLMNRVKLYKYIHRFINMN